MKTLKLQCFTRKEYLAAMADIIAALDATIAAIDNLEQYGASKHMIRTYITVPQNERN